MSHFQAVLLLSALALLPPQQNVKPATGILVGTVVDATSDKPIAGANVTFAFASVQGPNTRVVALTGADGRYMFTGLAAGQYTLNAQRGGYLFGTYGAISPQRGGVPIDLAEGERRTGLDIKLWKPGAISGRVTDDAGDPLVGISVQAWQRRPGRGGSTDSWTAYGSGRTDDRGIYRIKSLPPDGYLVFVEQVTASLPVSVLAEFQKATASSPEGPSSNPLVNEVLGSRVGETTPGTATGRMVGDQVESLSTSRAVADGVTRAAFVSQFYPAASTPGRATVVNVTTGETRDGVDLQLRPVKTVTVSGIVQGPPGPIAFTRVTLVPQFSGTTELMEASTVTDALGRFTLLRVPEGPHIIEVFSVPQVRAATASVVSMVQRADGSTSVSSTSAPVTTMPPLPPDPSWHAALPIATADKDLNDVMVSVRPGPRIAGRVEPPAGAAVMPAAMSRITVSLQRADGANRFIFGATPRTRVDANGDVNSQGFMPGKYHVTAGALPSGWALKSVMHGGVDVSQDALDLTSDVEDLVFTFTTTPAELAGVVRDAQNTIVAGALVMMFPADTPLTEESILNPRRVIRPIASTTGRYETRNLPPGDYFVVPLVPDDPENLASPAGGRFTLDALTALRARAARVTIAPGEHRTLDLTTKRR